MKKILAIITLLVATLSFNTVIAQKPDNREVLVVQTDIHCQNCVQKIEGSIPFEKGVKDVDVDLDNKIVTVEYDSRKTNVENILKGFERIKVKTEVVSQR